MIDRQGSERTLACDGCGDVFDTVHRDDFESMIAEAREVAWTIAAISGKFTHQCPDCRPSRLEAARRMFSDY
jgi:Fe2+ or Zn2+ uptake regulation protein